jgi:fatty acid desaturase
MVDGAGVGPRAARTIRRAKAAAACGRSRKGTIMLWTIFLVLAIMWLVGFSLNVGGGLIHLLLLVALVVLLFNFLGGRRVTG